MGKYCLSVLRVPPHSSRICDTYRRSAGRNDSIGLGDCSAQSDLPVHTGIDLIEQYYENTSPETVEELEEEAREKFDDLKNYKQLKISVSDMDLELGDIVGGRERITGIYMTAPVVRKIVSVTGKGRMSIDYKLKGED